MRRIIAKDVEGIMLWAPDNEHWIAETAIDGVKEFHGRFGIVVDIGAHIGGVALYAAKQGATFVYAIEPAPLNYFLLTWNIMQNRMESSVLPLPYAIGRVEQAHPSYPFDFRVLRMAGNSGMYSLQYKGAIQEAARVPVLDFEALLRRLPCVNYLKIDIEGGEYEIFQPSAELSALLRRVEYMNLELHTLDAAFFGESEGDEMERTITWLYHQGCQDHPIEECLRRKCIRSFNKHFTPICESHIEAHTCNILGGRRV